MKKALAALLALVLLVAMVPSVAMAEGDDYVLEIKGGQISENLETVDGQECLKVEVWINGIDDNHFDPMAPQLDKIGRDFPVIGSVCGEQMRNEIADARAAKDSVGGIIECAAVGVPAGLGEPMFGGMESRIAQIVYGIPAVKSVEFGLGAAIAWRCGSKSNDDYTIVHGEVRTLTNHNGGILGGITNGMPLIFSAAIKPTPSISKPQQTVNLETGEITTLEIKGRHDPCIVPRAVPVIEAAAAIAIFDAWLEFKARR